MKLEKTTITENRSILGYKYTVVKFHISIEQQQQIINLINISDNIHQVSDVQIFVEEKINPRYSPQEKKIFIPFEYSKNNENIVSVIQKIIGNKFEDVILFHEMGHAVEVSRKLNINKIDIKNHYGLNYLINGSSTPNNFNYFMIENYKEGFADCYAGLCYYKMHGDINIFEKISEVRKLRYAEIKKLNGDNYIHPNFNTEAPIVLKKLIQKLNKNGIDIRELPFTSTEGENIEKYIENASIKGSIQAVIKELENNDAFLSYFKKIGKDFTEEDRGKFKIYSYSESVKEYANKNNLPIKDLVDKLNNQMILPYFVEFQKRSNHEIISNQLIEELIDNQKLKKQVKPNLEIADVRNFEINNIEKISSSITLIRDKYYFNEKENNIKFRN